MRRPLIMTFYIASFAITAGVIHARPPLFEIDPIPDQSVEAGSRFRRQVTYTVLDEICWADNIRFELLSRPAGMTISSAGLIDWTPTLAQSGRSYSVTVHAESTARFGSPCGGALGQHTRAFLIDVTAPPAPDPPTAAINFELTERAVNNALASLTEVRGINFGKYLAGFVDAWWINLDSATIDVLPPSGGANRVHLSLAATAKTVLDLFVFDLPLEAKIQGYIEGDVVLEGEPNMGYTLVVDPTNLDFTGGVTVLPDWVLKIALNIVENRLRAIPRIELNLGTKLAPGLACARPGLTTNANATALVLEWDVAQLDCQGMTAAQ